MNLSTHRHRTPTPHRLVAGSLALVIIVVTLLVGGVAATGRTPGNVAAAGSATAHLADHPEGPSQVRDGVPTGTLLAPEPAPEPAAVAEPVPAPPPPAPVEPSAPVAYAAFQGLTLYLPTPTAIIVGFHEAAFPQALGIEPVGVPLINDNLPRFANRLPTAAGPNYVIMSSRGRANAPTSAVDIAAPHDAVINAPVTGTVVNVERYELYGTYPDLRIDIVPDDRPDLIVTMLHTTGRRVEPGQRVAAGLTPVADHANLFPFGSHIDRYAGGRNPHVHVEVHAR